ncbi:MAG TPA: hypothetical protein VNF50_08365 [Acidimicrobiales bacterium]|nr:hypothetical protein [Acidimicrobiales bacterium]
MPRPADAAHDWISIPDPEEERTWVFDVSFLLSNWTCIFGRGCQGVLTEPAPELVQGCCSYGAHFSDADDIARVEAAADTLTAEDWQFMKKGRRGGVTRTDKKGVVTTRLAEDACIFLNRPEFPGGAGCALHRAALGRGERPMDLKPEVCWQLPLRREDLRTEDGHVFTTVTQWDRRHWGAGGAEFAWWCTEEPAAFIGAVPVFEEMASELEAMVGPAVYGSIRQILIERQASGSVLPHPVVRRRPKASAPA